MACLQYIYLAHPYFWMCIIGEFKPVHYDVQAIDQERCLNDQGHIHQA